jgi:hypothetical protein
MTTTTKAEARAIANEALDVIGVGPMKVMQNRAAWQMSARFLCLTARARGVNVLYVDDVVVKVCPRGRRVSFSALSAPLEISSLSKERDEIVIAAVRNMQPGALFSSARNEVTMRRNVSMQRVSNFMCMHDIKKMRHNDIKAEQTDAHVIVTVPKSRFRALRDTLLE